MQPSARLLTYAMWPPVMWPPVMWPSTPLLIYANWPTEAHEFDTRDVENWHHKLNKKGKPQMPFCMFTHLLYEEAYGHQKKIAQKVSSPAKENFQIFERIH